MHAYYHDKSDVVYRIDVHRDLHNGEHIYDGVDSVCKHAYRNHVLDDIDSDQNVDRYIRDVYRNAAHNDHNHACNLLLVPAHSLPKQVDP
jgi:hypothetical protein